MVGVQDFTHELVEVAEILDGFGLRHAAGHLHVDMLRIFVDDVFLFVVVEHTDVFLQLNEECGFIHRRAPSKIC